MKQQSKKHHLNELTFLYQYHEMSSLPISVIVLTLNCALPLKMNEFPMKTIKMSSNQLILITQTV